MNVVYIGRYNKRDIMTGPEKVARRVFENITKEEKSIFFEYYFDGKKYGLFKKLFGNEKIECVNGCEVIKTGLITLQIKLIKLKPKIIHIITFERFALISFFCKLLFRVKIIYNMHGLMVLENKYFRKQNWFYDLKDKITEKIFIMYSDLICLLSKRFENKIKEYYNFDEKKIKYVNNGIDEEFSIAGKEKIINENKSLKILFIADINRREKGFNFLKESLEKIEYEIDFYVIDKKENKIVFENKLINVFCVDKMSSAELADFLRDKDVFISASNYEPFGITSVECMASGLIPLLTGETGASELIENGVNGFIYNYNDGDRLIDILNELKNNIELRKRVSEKTTKIYDILKWGNITTDYIKIYKISGK